MKHIDYAKLFIFIYEEVILNGSKGYKGKRR